MQRPFTPDQVAAHWGCSANHVRKLIHSGELRAFRLGERLFRIPAEAVLEFEEAQKVQGLVDVEEVRQPALNDVIVIAHSRERSPRKSGSQQ
jgi:excisionase family DNA binding protein